MTQVVITSPESGATPPAPAEQRPEWQPEGFSGDQKALAKSWTDQRAEVTRLQQELAKSKGGATGEQPAASPGEQPGATPETPPNAAPAIPPKDPQQEAAEKVAAATGFDVNQFQSEYDSTGDIAQENRQKIADGIKSAFPQGTDVLALVNEFIDGRKAIHTNDRSAYMAAAGGEESFNAMIAWAAQNLPQGEVEAYNRAVNSRDRNTTSLAIAGLKAKFDAQREPSLLSGTQAVHSGSVQPFQSSAQMTKAMSDPRYQTDQAYRDEVARRLAVSQF